eukprot:10067852-Alexandrium_andersonii.AAC.1
MPLAAAFVGRVLRPRRVAVPLGPVPDGSQAWLPMHPGSRHASAAACCLASCGGWLLSWTAAPRRRPVNPTLLPSWRPASVARRPSTACVSARGLRTSATPCRW